MNLSKPLDQAADSLDQINWKTVAKEMIELWTTLFKGVIVLVVITKVAGETLGNWVHRTNDQFAANWVRMLGLEPSTPAEAGQEIGLIADEVSVPTTPAVEVELTLPPVQAEVVETLVLDEQPPPVHRSRRSSAPRSQEVTVTEHEEVQATKKPRGRRAHAQRKRTAA